MIHEAGMHLVQKMSAGKKAEFLEALKDLKGGGRMTSFLASSFLHDDPKMGCYFAALFVAYCCCLP